MIDNSPFFDYLYSYANVGNSIFYRDFYYAVILSFLLLLFVTLCLFISIGWRRYFKSHFTGLTFLRAGNVGSRRQYPIRSTSYRAG